MTERLDAASRIALAAMLHDLGKFAERARPEDISGNEARLADHEQMYCPRKMAGSKFWYTHKHAAWTALALDAIEPWLPPLKGVAVPPFASWGEPGVEDSLINAAAMHHKPGTMLQWIIATGDRVASGFERSEWEKYNAAEDQPETGRNHYQARMLSLFEQIEAPKLDATSLRYRYPLVPLSPEGIVPRLRQEVEPADNSVASREYRVLWDAFLDGLGRIPASHRDSFPLWLDHFDSLWATFTQAIPAATAFGTRPDVSLYDHSRTTASVATALWRYHHDRGHDPEHIVAGLRSREGVHGWDEETLLLVQGDFFGIQDFIFAHGSETNRRAAKLLRGRSFYVSLITECAAVRVLEALELPPTSQVINAAGRFLIVAPNTEEVRSRLESLRTEFSQWFIEHTFGQAGLGLVWQPACCNDFCSRNSNESSSFMRLMGTLGAQLEDAKMRRFDLCGAGAPPPVFSDYLERVGAGGGVCAVDGRSPADSFEGGLNLSAMARDQIRIGSFLVSSKRERVILSRDRLGGEGSLVVPLFGLHVYFTGGEEASGRFGEAVRSRSLLRCWDYSLPVDAKVALWNGYARRNISAYVPLFDPAHAVDDERYDRLREDHRADARSGMVRTFHHLACEGRWMDVNAGRDKGAWRGVSAIAALKGDIDNLGWLFSKGVEGRSSGGSTRASFARWASLSRQINNYFAVYLPWLCRSGFSDTYTVFAGGDDFFLVGPWRSQLRLAQRMHDSFAAYVAHNPKIHFSAGCVVVKPSLPVRYLADSAEEALHAAKTAEKNRITVFGQTVTWDNYAALLQAQQRLEELAIEHGLSTAYVYSLLGLTNKAADTSLPENSLWRAHLNYRTWRHLVSRYRGKDNEERRRQIHETLIGDIGERGIGRFRADYRIALQAHLYSWRD